VQHSALENGGWSKLSLNEQMGNIGTEVGRIIRAKKQNDQVAMNNALDRALELFDLTMSDGRRKHQLREIARTREVLIDSLAERKEYHSDLTSIDKYLMHFAVASRLSR
jgi:hypothetical protein